MAHRLIVAARAGRGAARGVHCALLAPSRERVGEVVRERQCLRRGFHQRPDRERAQARALGVVEPLGDAHFKRRRRLI